ncbi:hypothetical protein EWM64_g3148 [Hericium alpestre]|uniref:CUE domain-containing protein n=1 Tax=Hericium alpestre TaxID=135208 RepID=A0A4Z0A197_9AGAM|nr:hypothetical protein EWM64_g3148 [Hericium alpestre]
MGEVVNAFVAFAVIVFIVRWATTSKNEPSEEQAAARALQFRPKKVTPDMTETISTMFPDMPRENIHYDLLRTGSVQQTSDKIIERGFLEAPPPAYFTLYPRSATARAPAPAVPPRPTGSSTSAAKKSESLISRFQLEQRAATAEEIAAEADAGGRAAWEDTAEKREASLRERKAKMILAARQRLLAQQAEKSSG